MKHKLYIAIVITAILISNFFCSSTKSSIENIENNNPNTKDLKIDNKTAQDKTPKIFVKKDEFNFGEVPEGTEVIHFFEISNIGNDILKILDIETSCGCTNVPLSENEKSIEPGKSIKIKLVYNTKGHPGSENRTAKIITNDPVDHFKILSLIGTVTSKRN